MPYDKKTPKNSFRIQQFWLEMEVVRGWAIYQDKNPPEITDFPHHLPNKLFLSEYEFVAGSKLSWPCGFY